MRFRWNRRDQSGAFRGAAIGTAVAVFVAGGIIARNIDRGPGGSIPSALPTAGDTSAGSTGWRHAIASLTPAGSGGNPVAGVDTPGACGTGGSLLTVSGGVYTIHGSSAGTIVDGCDFGVSTPQRVVMASGGSTQLRRSRIQGRGTNDANDPGISIGSGACPCDIADVEITTFPCSAATDPNCFTPSSPLLDTTGAVMDPFIGRPEHIDNVASYLVSNPGAQACCDAYRQDRTIDQTNKGNTNPVTVERLYAWDTQRGLGLTNSSNFTMSDSWTMNYNPHSRCGAFGNNPPLGFDGQPYDYAHSSQARDTSGAHDNSFLNDVMIVGPCSNASGILALYPDGDSNNGLGNFNITVDGGLWEVSSSTNGGAYGLSAGFTPSNESPNYNIVVKNLQLSIRSGTSNTGYLGIPGPFNFPSGLAQNWTQSSSQTVGPVGGCTTGSPPNCPSNGICRGGRPCLPSPQTNLWQDNVLYAPGASNNGQCVGPGGSIGGTPGSGTTNCRSLITH